MDKNRETQSGLPLTTKSGQRSPRTHTRERASMDAIRGENQMGQIKGMLDAVDLTITAIREVFARDFIGSEHFDTWLHAASTSAKARIIDGELDALTDELLRLDRAAPISAEQHARVLRVVE